MPAITAVCRVARLQPDAGSIGVTAIDKQALDEPVAVKKMGVYGDVQANRVHHGGFDKAVYAFADEDAVHFEGILGRDVEPGLFGENLRTSGLDITGAVLGERWHVGDDLVVEVTMPRTPCATFARRMREAQWVKRFTAEGRPGAYLRVIKAGPVVAGDQVVIGVRPTHGVTIGDCFTGLTAEQARDLLEIERQGGFVAEPVLKIARKAAAQQLA